MKRSIWETKRRLIEVSLNGVSPRLVMPEVCQVCFRISAGHQGECG